VGGGRCSSLWFVHPDVLYPLLTLRCKPYAMVSWADLDRNGYVCGLDRSHMYTLSKRCNYSPRYILSSNSETFQRLIGSYSSIPKTLTTPLSPQALRAWLSGNFPWMGLSFMYYERNQCLSMHAGYPLYTPWWASYWRRTLPLFPRSRGL